MRALYRIHVEDTVSETGETVAGIVSEYFEALTVLRGTGYWQGQAEKTAVVEVYAEERGLVDDCTRALCKRLKQQAVLVAVVSCTYTLCTTEVVTQARRIAMYYVTGWHIVDGQRQVWYVESGPADDSVIDSAWDYYEEAAAEAQRLNAALED